MQTLSPFTISGILILVFYLTLSLPVFLNGKNKLSKIYALYLFAISMWGLGAIVIGTTQDVTTAKIAWKLSYSWILLIPALLYHIAHGISGRKTRWDLYIIYGQALFFNVELYRDKIMSDFLFMFNSFYFHRATPTYTLSFIAWLIVIIIAHTILIINYKKSFPSERNELKIVIPFTAIGFLAGIGNFLPPYGINLYPWANFLVLTGFIGTTYALIKHNFLDIKIAVRKSITYSVLVLFATIFYISTIVISEQILRDSWGYRSTTLSVLVAFLLGILFFPLQNKLQGFIDRLVFLNTPEEIAYHNNLLLSEVSKTEKMRTVATLATSVVHEIRNPLTSLKTFVEYFPKKKDDPAFLNKFESMAKNEIGRIEQILNELLSFAKPSPLSLTETDLRKTLEHSLNLTANQLKAKNIKLISDFAPGLPLIKADANKLTQVFINLIINAIDAMPDGGTLTVTTALIAPDSSNGPGGGGISISFADTGCGMPKDVQKQIFDPFFSTKATGTGLGLSVVKGIIDDHGGKISVESKEAAGTVFRIVLAVTAEEKP